MNRLKLIAVLLAALPLSTVLGQEGEETTRARLKNLGGAVRAYRLLHQGKGPQRLSELYSVGLVENLSDFVIPGSGSKIPMRAEIDNGSDFTLDALPGTKEMLVRERLPHHHQGQVLAVFADGSIRTVAVSDAGGGMSMVGPAEPPGLSLAPGLTVARWMTVRRIALLKKDEVGETRHVKISADGSKIVVATYNGVYVLNPDGSGRTQLSDKSTEHIDISANGKKVAWYNEPDGLVVADLEGGVKKQTMPGALNLSVSGTLRLTAAGDQLFVRNYHPNPADQCIYQMRTDGSKPQLLVTPKALDDLLARETRGVTGSWGSGQNLDISDDGARLVFIWGRDAFARAADGALRRLTRTQAGEPAVVLARISGDGARVACLKDGANKPRTLTLMAWDGRSRRVVHDKNLGGAVNAQLTRDGRKVIVTDGVRLFDGERREQQDVANLILNNTLFHTPRQATWSADGRRVCLLASAPDHNLQPQLLVVDFHPAAAKDAPALGRVSVAPLALPPSLHLTATAEPSDPNLKSAGIQLMRGGMPLGRFAFPMNDEGRDGDAKAKDGVFTARCQIEGAEQLPPGPLTLRFCVFTTQNVALLVDVEGVELRRP